MNIYSDGIDWFWRCDLCETPGVQRCGSEETARRWADSHIRFFHEEKK